ncbi:MULTISPECIES: glycosyltransferase family 2 protein [unclassified Flavobacterium]|nr:MULTISPECIES: glycosyltransferase family 2 protein [unclassified Flavobacterium]OWU91774.1 hypothetical protein APR43_06715 [Flavobacterium sp. NLM]
MLPKISIITVVYNDEQYISKTIESVLNQSYDNIEYIIVDGGSTDSTVERIKNYTDAIDAFISEKDRGIYDGMNKGIQKSSGDYLLFLNSGDFFHNNNILNVISGYIEKSGNADIIYGDFSVKSEDANFGFIRKAGDVGSIKKEMVFSHQACFIKGDLHRKNNYDLKYRICADYNFLLKSYLEGAKFYKVPEIIATVSNGGLSDMNRIKVFKERLEIKKVLIPSVSNYYYYFKSVSYLSFIGLVKKSIPNSLFLKFYKLKYKIKKRETEV